ncbi:MAG: Maf family protein, partial [Clostridia bacterium]|nr:Maf family protein [Clostridia bacterium]
MIYSYVLASASSRRRDILSNLGINFETLVSGVDESVPPGMDPETAALELAKRKAAAVLEKRPDSCVIGADTIVVIDGEVLGKPKDEGDAYRMLKML